MGNTRVGAEVSRSQIFKDLVITAKNFGFILRSPLRCSRLDSNLISFEYLNDHSNYSAVIDPKRSWWGVDMMRTVTKLLEERIFGNRIVSMKIEGC